MSACRSVEVASPVVDAKRLSVTQVDHLVREALGADDLQLDLKLSGNNDCRSVSGNGGPASHSLGEQLRGIWQAIVAAQHPSDRKIIAQRLTDHAKRNGLRRQCRHRDGNDLDHVISWGTRGWDPFGGRK